MCESNYFLLIMITIYDFNKRILIATTQKKKKKIKKFYFFFFF